MEVENFRAAEVLKVLVVEPDDSTRNVISALLRKCSYKVTLFSDGLVAWELLKENPHSIDLILTEVDLPSISGFTLLTLVMDHHVCKRIPVVMMSSKDSVSTVVKCMLKGAADFLIKPIRKNELKNIWQHVWRRQISTAENKSPSISEACPKIGAASQKTSAVSSPSNVYISSEQDEAGCKETKIILKMESEDSTDKMKTNNNLDDECVKIGEVSGCNGTVGAISGMEIIGNGTKNLAELRVLDDGTILKRAKLCTPEGPNVQGEQRNGTIPFLARGVFSQESQSPTAIDLIGSFGDFKGKCETSKFKIGKSNTVCGHQLDSTLQGSVPSGPGRSETDGGRLLNHSSASAFSRYNTGNRFRCSLPSYSMVNSKARGAVIEYKAICSNGINAESPADEHERKTKSVMEDCTGSVAFMLGSSKCDRLNSSSTCAKINGNTTTSKLVDDFGSSIATVQGSNNGIQLCGGSNKMDAIRSREREAALIKFRQKRKERCFEKKVRYHSRKQLAEQRPRMKGQFVRQMQDPATSTSAS